MRPYAKDSRQERSFSSFSHNLDRFHKPHTGYHRKPAGYLKANFKGAARTQQRDELRVVLAAYRTEQATYLGKDTRPVYVTDRKFTWHRRSDSKDVPTEMRRKPRVLWEWEFFDLTFNAYEEWFAAPSEPPRSMFEDDIDPSSYTLDDIDDQWGYDESWEATDPYDRFRDDDGSEYYPVTPSLLWSEWDRGVYDDPGGMPWKEIDEGLQDYDAWCEENVMNDPAFLLWKQVRGIE